MIVEYAVVQNRSKNFKQWVGRWGAVEVSKVWSGTEVVVAVNLQLTRQLANATSHLTSLEMCTHKVFLFVQASGGITRVHLFCVMSCL